MYLKFVIRVFLLILHLVPPFALDFAGSQTRVIMNRNSNHATPVMGSYLASVSPIFRFSSHGYLLSGKPALTSGNQQTIGKRLPSQTPPVTKDRNGLHLPT